MKYINLPKKLNQEFYQKCRIELVNLCQGNPDVVSIYEIGTVLYPGISDLDLMLCLKNKLNNDLNIEEQFSQELNYITSGHVLKINEENFRDMCIIDDRPDLKSKYLYGRKFQFSNFDDKTFEICRILDWLPVLVFTLLRSRNSSQVDVIKKLLIMSSVVISLDKVSKLTGNFQFCEFGKKVYNLRSTWFSNKNRIQDFDILFVESVVQVLKAIKFIDEYLIKNRYIFGDLGKVGTFLKIPRGPEFVFGDETEIEKGRIRLPKSFFFFLASQAVSSNGFISNHLKNSFDIELTDLDINDHIDDKLKKTIKKRIEYCNSLADFFRANNLKTGLFKYGWFI